MTDRIETAIPEPADPRAENAVKDGLFTERDFIRPDELDEYDQFRAGLLGCLNPKNALEQNYADEIVTAQWRLRRCRLIEASIGERCYEGFRLAPEDEERQKSVDRARAQATNALRKASAELRMIQTERECRNAYTFGKNWGLADSGRAFGAFKEWRKEKESARTRHYDEFKAMLDRELGPLPEDVGDSEDPSPGVCTDPSSEPSPVRPAAPGLFCKNTPVTVNKVGRNQLCPCGSGLKYKKCCIDAPRPQPALAA